MAVWKDIQSLPIELGDGRLVMGLQMILIGYVLCITTMILVELMHDVVSVDAENP
jgi:hypothetical protein